MSLKFDALAKHNSSRPFQLVVDLRLAPPFNQPRMTARDLLDEMQCLRQRRALYIARLSPEQAQQLARQDMQAHSQQTKQFERAYLHEEMTMRARVNPYFKAVIDQAAIERLAAALQQSRAAGLTSHSAMGLEESCG